MFCFLLVTLKILAVIPARGGSRRVPKKNIRLLAGKPLLAYTVEVALKTRCIDRMIVSTDDAEIARIAEEYGAEVPFLRPAELARDDTPDQPVLRHALECLKQKEGYEPDLVLNLRPTTPFKTPEIIEAVVRRCLETHADIVRTMSRVQSVHHPYWMYRVSEEGWASPFVEGIRVSDYYRSQLLPPVYRINGVVDAVKAGLVTNGSLLDNQKMAVVIVPEEVSVDTDTELDFALCEALISRRNLG
ncbi:MAG: cytidylyltransferase domain-containing protein [Candidatus Binatia bacterium]